MRKAFDANIPKLKPRLRSADSVASDADGESSPDVTELGSRQFAESLEADLAPVEELLAQAAEAADPEAARDSWDAAPEAWSELKSEPQPEPTRLPLRPEAGARAPVPAAASPADDARADDAAGSADVASRRERLLAVKRKVEDAVRPRPRPEPTPESPARAGESALGLVRELETQLARAREIESALRADLDDARAEVARGATEARRTAERLSVVERDSEEKRSTLGDLLAELSALEEERDRAVERAHALAALDEERQSLLDQLATRAEDAEAARSAAEAEIGRLGEELDQRGADVARLRHTLAQVTRERDELAREAAAARREKTELDEARRALEQVHDALSQARTRLA